MIIYAFIVSMFFSLCAYAASCEAGCDGNASCLAKCAEKPVAKKSNTNG